MTIEPYEEKYFCEQCNPLIRKSLTEEQRREVKRLIGLSMRCSNKGARKLSFNVWFLHLYFVVLYFGKEKRSTSRRIEEFNKLEIFFSIISMLFSFVFTLGIIFVIFLSLYHIKSSAGIDLFEEWHLKDLLK